MNGVDYYQVIVQKNLAEHMEAMIRSHAFLASMPHVIAAPESAIDPIKDGDKELIKELEEVNAEWYPQK